MMIDLKHGDCLELLKEIPDGSVDLILTDPPYGTVKNAKFYDYCNGVQWDNVIPFMPMWGQINRVLRKNGKCILFSQEPFTSDLIKSTIPNMPFSYRNIWIKDSFANPLLCKNAPVNYYEDICIFSKRFDEQKNDRVRLWLQLIQNKMNIFHTDEIIINAYLKSGIAKNKASAKTIAKHKLDFTYSQLERVNKRHYELLKNIYFFDETFEQVNEMYDELDSKFPSIFNLPTGKKHKSNVFQYKKDYDGYHPTQKPIALLEDLINTFSNAGDHVLDFTMGSGSTGVACVKTGRKFTGIEKDSKYFKIAEQRINGVNKAELFSCY